MAYRSPVDARVFFSTSIDSLRISVSDCISWIFAFDSSSPCEEGAFPYVSFSLPRLLDRFINAAAYFISG